MRRIVEYILDGHVFYGFSEEGLLPYIKVAEEELRDVPKPFIVSCIHPSCGIGVSVDWLKRCIVDIPPVYDHKKEKRNRYVLNKNVDARCEFKLLEPGEVSVELLYRLGGRHFEKKRITRPMIEALVDYCRPHKSLVLTVYSGTGEWLANDFSIIDGRVYGIFCDWNHDHPKRRLGHYCILKLIEWCNDNGYSIYDLGGCAFDYKKHFATRFEPSLGIVLIQEDHPYLRDHILEKINMIRE